MMPQLVEPHVEKINGYIPGLSIEAMKKKFGLDHFVKLASNEGPFGPSPLAIQAAEAALINAHRYPNDIREDLKIEIAKHLACPGIDERNVCIGNGSNEIVTVMTRTFLGEEEVLLNGWPSFMVYRMSAQAMNRRELTIPLDPQLHYDIEQMIEAASGDLSSKVKLVFLGNPNNPTGQYISQPELKKFIEAMPDHTIVVIDEAYFEYVDKKDYNTCIDWVMKRPRTVVLRTFSKIFGLAGLRIGYAVADPQITEIMNRVMDPFNVNSVAQSAAFMALKDAAHVAIGRANNLSQMKRLKEEVSGLGLWVSESVSNFILIGFPPECQGGLELTNRFLKKGVIVRPVQNYDLPNHLRVTVGRPEENTIFLSALKDILKSA